MTKQTNQAQDNLPMRKKAGLRKCAADRDGECAHKQCPQLRDGEPRKTGRHCPLDIEHKGE